MLIDHGFYYLNLPVEIGFAGGSVPDDVDALLARRRNRTRVNRLPEDMRATFGNHRNAFLRGTIAACK